MKKGKLNKMVQRIKTWFFAREQKIKRKVLTLMALVTTGAIFMPGIAFAAEEIDPDALMQNFVNWFFNILGFFGAILLGFGIYNLAVSAFTSHDAHQRMQGIGMIFGGALCLGARIVLGILGVVV